MFSGGVDSPRTAGCKTDELTSWIFAQPYTERERQAWALASQACFQQPESPLPLADKIQHVKLADTLGNLGAAALPLAIAYGLGRLKHPLHKVERVAIVLQSPQLCAWVLTGDRV